MIGFAEDYAMADILSGGRVIFGVGRGYHTREVETFGAPLLDQPANPDQGLPSQVVPLVRLLEGPPDRRHRIGPHLDEYHLMFDRHANQADTTIHLTGTHLPEPGSLLLLAAGAAGLAALRRLGVRSRKNPTHELTNQN